MPRRTAFLLLLVLPAALAGCGDEAKTTTPEAAGAQTLYVKASGMVKKLGIT